MLRLVNINIRSKSPIGSAELSLLNVKLCSNLQYSIYREVESYSLTFKKMPKSNSPISSDFRHFNFYGRSPKSPSMCKKDSAKDGILDLYKEKTKYHS